MNPPDPNTVFPAASQLPALADAALKSTALLLLACLAAPLLRRASAAARHAGNASESNGSNSVATSAPDQSACRVAAEDLRSSGAAIKASNRSAADFSAASANAAVAA